MKNLKKLSLIPLLLLVAVNVFAASASLINSPAATVNLIRNKVITTADLDAAIKAQGATQANALDILQILINNEVFLQGAERDGITVSNAQRDQLYASQKSYIEQQNGITLTNAQYEDEVIREFGSVESYKKSLSEQYIMQAYLMQKKGDDLQNKIKQPTDSEIRAFYKKNATQFVSPENVKISHIYIDKTGETAKDSANKARFEALARDIRSSKLTFESAVKQYSEDTDSKSKGGDIGWLTSNNTAAREGWGDAFCDAVLSLDDGETSDVLESKLGYHIVRCSVHNDAKLLTINDPISPEDNTTVYQYIQSGLLYQNQQQVMAESLNEIVKELTAQAKIRILYK